MGIQKGLVRFGKDNIVEQSQSFNLPTLSKNCGRESLDPSTQKRKGQLGQLNDIYVQYAYSSQSLRESLEASICLLKGLLKHEYNSPIYEAIKIETRPKCLSKRDDGIRALEAWRSLLKLQKVHLTVASIHLEYTRVQSSAAIFSN